MAKARQIRVALAQLNSKLGDNQANLRRALKYIDRAAKEGADLIMFPELYLQGYEAYEKFAQTAEPIPGPTTEQLMKKAAAHGIYVVMGMARLGEGHPWCVYNSLCFVGPEGLLGYYDKIHLGDFHPYKEGMYFAPGGITPVFDTAFGRVSVQICYDVWFPELSRTYALKGSLVNLIISAGPDTFVESWTTMLKARSMENLFDSVYCNVVGKQTETVFFGGSKVVGADGKVRIEAKLHEEDFVIGAVDIDAALQLRRRWMLFRDRAPHLYSSITTPIGSVESRTDDQALNGEPQLSHARLSAARRVPSHALKRRQLDR